uniref:Myb-like domain-containing protein n=1 Tax=Magallana gigas TaxID=29159 RepID=A0A8W8NVX5_MAGGI
MAEHKSYWTQVHLKYSDGLEIVQVLDAPTIRRLENGDEELLQQIRRNLEDCGQATQTQPACIEEENVQFEDDQASNSDLEDNQPVSWTRDATELLISLYEDYEQELEDPRKKKKDTWKKITAALNEAGYKYVQNKVEGKWRSLLASHKDLSLNKKKTGQKRKTFQYFEKIDNIISKRHDINPPFTSGSSLQNQKEAKFSTKQLDKNMNSCTSIGCTIQTDEDSSTTKNSGLKFMPNLKKLTITAMNSFQEIALLRVVDLFLEFEFQNLEVLVLKKFPLENSLFSAFTAALSHVQLSVLQFVSCDEVTVGQLKCVLEHIKTLKYCDIQCNLESVLDKHVFAELANHLVGEVNLSLNNLEAVPSNLLRFKRSAYRATIVT